MVTKRFTTRTHQRPVADRVARGSQIVGVSRFHLGHDGFERAGHVRACVTVGNRVDVEPVECAGVGLYCVTERRDEIAQRFGVDPFECGHGIGV